MENLHDYSNYVSAAYGIAAFSLAALLTLAIAKYFLIKSRIRNEKSA